MFLLMEQRAESRLSSFVEHGGIPRSDLVTFRIPLSLPYQANWSDYQRIDGEVSIGSHNYRYIKQRVKNDTLYLVCVNAKEKDHIAGNARAYTDKLNDLNTDSAKKQLHKQVKVDDFFTNTFHLPEPFGIINAVTHRRDGILPVALGALADNEQPPDEKMII